jgi:DoxX-like family
VRVRPVADVDVSPPTTTSRGFVRTGWVITGFVGLFLLVDGGARVAGFAPYVEGMTKFGYSASLATPVGLALLASTILMLIPRTAVVGCILVTGYLGGATATHVRAQDPWFLFPVVLGVLSWLGLYLRDSRLRDLVPFRT